MKEMGHWEVRCLSHAAASGRARNWTQPTWSRSPSIRLVTWRDDKSQKTQVYRMVFLQNLGQLNICIWLTELFLYEWSAWTSGIQCCYGKQPLKKTSAAKRQAWTTESRKNTRLDQQGSRDQTGIDLSKIIKELEGFEISILPKRGNLEQEHKTNKTTMRQKQSLPCNVEYPFLAPKSESRSGSYFPAHLSHLRQGAGGVLLKKWRFWICRSGWTSDSQV